MCISNSEIPVAPLTIVEAAGIAMAWMEAA
jgi:hypothetical protein